MPPISDSQRAARIKAVQEHFHIENTHDLDAVMATFGNMCSFLANNERHEGREAVRAFYGEFFRGFPGIIQKRNIHLRNLHFKSQVRETLHIGYDILNPRRMFEAHMHL